MTTSRQAILAKLRGACAGSLSPNAALEVLVGSQPVELDSGSFRASESGPIGIPELAVPQVAVDGAFCLLADRALGHGKKKTIYLDEEAERDLQFLLDRLASERPENITRSEGVRRALHAARATMEAR